MEETMIHTALNSIIDTVYGDAERNITTQRMPDNTFKVYISSPDSGFLASLIGRRGETITAIKHIFYVWAFRNKIKLILWAERVPIKNYD